MMLSIQLKIHKVEHRIREFLKALNSSGGKPDSKH